MPSAENNEERLRHLFAYNDQPHQFTPTEVDALIEAIDHLKILDPACGFGEIRKRITEFGSEVPQAALKPEGWSFSAGNSALVEKLKAAGTPLKEYVRGRCCYGIKTGLNDAFVIDGETRKRLLADDPKSKDLIKPWLRGRDVKRWRVDWAGLYAIVFPFGFHTRLAEYPSILRHLTQFEAELRKRGQCVSSRSGTGKGQHHWLELAIQAQAGENLR